MADGYAIRRMTRQDLDLAVVWAAAEGWNPGLHDADCFYAADPDGFWVGELDGKPVAVISAVRYGASFAFVGFYIVHPEYRHQGYGLRIWDAAMESVAGRNVAPDGVVEQQDNYKKSGFRLAYRNIRYQGVGGGEPDGAGVVSLSDCAWAEVLAYDASFFPESREAFLRCWISRAGSHALGVMRQGCLAGYGVLRPCQAGFKIGPLFADDSGVARALLSALRARAGEGVEVFLDTPEVNAAAVELARENGMTPCFETARMYTGVVPEIAVERTYGVTTFEIG